MACKVSSACDVELVRCRDIPDGLHEKGAFRHHFDIRCAEIVNIGPELIGFNVLSLSINGCVGLDSRVGHRSQHFQHEVSRMETSSRDYTIFITIYWKLGS